MIVRANFIRAGCCGSAQRGGKEFAKVFFESSVHKAGWKLVLSQNVGKFLNVVVEADPGVIDFKCPVHLRSY